MVDRVLTWTSPQFEDANGKTYFDFFTQTRIDQEAETGSSQAGRPDGPPGLYTVRPEWTILRVEYAERL